MLLLIRKTFDYLLVRNANDLYPIAYTLSCAREHYNNRVYFVVRNVFELLATLNRTLLELRKTINTHNQYNNINYNLLLKMNNAEIKMAFEKTGQAYQNGTTINWEGIYTIRKIINAPNYYFDKNIHWIESSKYGLSTKEQYLYHHQIDDKPIAPAALSISRIITKLDHKINNLQDIYWLKPITSLNEIKEIITNDAFALQDNDGNTYFKGELGAEASPFQPELLHNLLKEPNHFELIEAQDLYAQYYKLGYNYGNTYQKLSCIKRSDKFAIGVINSDLDTTLDLSPAIIDAGFQIAITPFAIQSLIQKN